MRIARWLLLILLVAPRMSAQMTQVSALVQDANGERYVNCSWSVVFVGQNTNPGAGPYQPAALLVGQQGTCDSSGNLRVSLADNVVTVRPTPSQWNFSICSAPGYQPGGTYCRSNMLVTITGTIQNLTSFFQPLMPLLPTGGGGGGGGGGYITDATPLMGLMKTGSTLGLQTTCVAGQYLSWTGSAWACTGAGVGGGTNVTINGIAAVPNQLNFTNTLNTPAGSSAVNFQLNGNTVGAFVTGGGGGGGGFTVNGTTPSGTVNFNASTPGPPPNGINVNWSLVGTNLTAAIVGDGNPNSCLLGTGIFAACPGGGGGGGGTPLPTTPAYDLFASTGSGGAQASGILGGSGFMRGQVFLATGDVTSAAAPFPLAPNASVEYFPTGYNGIGTAHGLAAYVSHSGSTTAGQNGGVALAGGTSTANPYQIYLDCEAAPTAGCDFKIPVTYNGSSIGGGGGVASINGVGGAFNFTGAVSCASTTCNFTGGGGGITGATTSGGLVQSGSTLGMLTTCAANQYLAWVSNAWTCTTPTVGGSGTVSSGTAGHFTWYAAAGTTVASNAHLDDSVTTAATITSQETLAAPGINVTGSGGISMTGVGGTLPAPVAGQGGIGIGPSNVPQYYSNGGAWTAIGGGGGATLPSCATSNCVLASNAAGTAAVDTGVKASGGFIQSGASIVNGTAASSPFTGANASQEFYNAGGTITPSTGSPITFTNGAALFMGHGASTAGASGDAGIALGGGSATPTSRIYLDCEVASCDFKVQPSYNGTALGTGGSGSGTVSPNNGSIAQPVAAYAAGAGSTTVQPMTGAANTSSGLQVSQLNFGSSITAAPEIAFQRAGAYVLSLGTSGAPTNPATMLRTANSCPSGTADITFTTTAGTFCTGRNLPPISPAQNWVVHCVVPWNFTAGSGTATVAFGLILGGTPNAASSWTGVVWGTGTGPVYQGTTISSNGTQPIITVSGLTIAIGPIYRVTIDGTISLSATGSTTVSFYATTTPGTGAIKAGAYCIFE